MTVVTKIIADVAGNPDFGIWRFGADLALAADDVTLKSSRVVSVIPDAVDGKAVLTVDLDPGPVAVEYKGITTVIEVPDSEEPQDLLALLDAGSFMAGGEGFTPSAAYRGSPVDEVTDDGQGGAEFWVLGESVGTVPMPSVTASNIAGSGPTGVELLKSDTPQDARVVAEVERVFQMNVRDYGAIGDGTSHPATELGYPSQASMREAYWTGVRWCDDDAVVGFDTQLNPSTMYIEAGSSSAHVTFNATSGAITIDVGGGFDIGTYPLTGTTGTDGNLTIAANASVMWVENRTGARLAVKWSVAANTDEVDMVAIQHALSLATLNAGTDGRVNVYIPPGDYLCNKVLYPYGNTRVENAGVMRFTGDYTRGGFVFIQTASNVEITGGIWNSNSRTNQNTIGVGNGSISQKILGPLSENVWLHDLEVRRARHGGSHLPNETDSEQVGRGGGKGITIQHGATGVVISDVVIDDCDLGFSIEGLEYEGAYSENINVSNVVIKNCRYMGMFLTSVQNTASLYGQTTSVVLNNIQISDCGVGNTIDTVPVPCADLFGVITCQSMVAVKASNIQVRSSSGKMTVFRGSINTCEWDVQVFCQGQLVDVINSAPYGGWNPSYTASRYSKFDVHLAVMGTVIEGHLVNSDATYPANTSSFDFDMIWWNGGSPVGTPQTKYTNALPASSIMSVTDLSNGRTSVFNSGADPANNTSWAGMFFNGFAVEDDSGGNLTKIGPSRSSLALADNGGATRAFVNTNGFNVNSSPLVLGGVGIYWGAGSPESVVTAPEGSLYLRTDGGSGTSLYVKELGATGATGWTNLGNSGGQPTAFFSATERADANFPATGELDSGHAYSVANNGSQGFYTVGGELRSDVSLAYLNFGLDAPVRSCYLDVTWTDDGEADDEIAVLIVADGLFAQAVGDYADSGAHILIRRNKWTYQVRRADGSDTTTLADYTYDEPLSYGVRHRIGFTFDGTTCTMIMPDTSTYEVPFDADIANWWGNYACVELVASASGQNKVGINTFTFSSIVDAEPALPAEFQPALRQATGTTKKTVGADVALTPTLQTVFTMEFVVPPSKMVGCNAQFQVDVADDGITTGQLTVENNPTSTVSARLTDHVAWKGMLNIVGVLDCSDFPVGVRRSIWLRLANDGTGTYKEDNAQLPTMMLVDLTQGLFP